jgi:riboflavin kinase / FMN adenylyltransferase
MRVVDDIRSADTSDLNDVVLTVGSFDGIHVGHRAILDRVVERAREIGGTPAILTMRPHPREFFAPESAPNLLTGDGKQCSLLAEAGIEVLFVLPFDRTTADMPPERFVRNVLVDQCHARSVIVGHDCRFGKDARGDIRMLRSEGERHGFTVEEIPPLLVDAERVSSTLVRERVLQGDLDTVQRLLGRRYSITGRVQQGRGIGRQIGFPTANIKPYHNAIPAQGVYIAEAIVVGRRFPAAVNIGIAPTIRHEDITIEAHILDFDEELTGAEIEVVFHRRIRPEMKFRGRDELVKQITQDVEEVREYFNES